MPITHTAVKASGDRGYANEWNDNHVITDELQPKSPATLIIAANDSLNKTRADYVCDGANDEVEINAAIAALPVNRGCVMLLEGNFIISDTINLIAWTHLKGQGHGTVIKLADGAGNTMIDMPIGQAYMKVSDLTLDGNRVNQALLPIYGIHGGGQNCEIRNCYIHDVKHSGILITEWGTLIQSNSIYWCGAAGEGAGIFIYGGNSCRICDNKCESNEKFGILLYSETDYNTVSGNICGGNGGGGIWLLAASTYNTITGNQLIGNVSYGYREQDATCDHNEIVGNVAVYNGTANISLQGASSEAAHNMVA